MVTLPLSALCNTVYRREHTGTSTTRRTELRQRFALNEMHLKYYGYYQQNIYANVYPPLTNGGHHIRQDVPREHNEHHYLDRQQPQGQKVIPRLYRRLSSG